MNSIESLIKLSLKRKPKRLSTSYSHDNILKWLKDILPCWEICIPIWRNEDLSLALADWPPNEEQDVINANDILDGACEQLARYLSYQMKMEVEHDEFNSISKSSHTLKSKLELLDPRESAEFTVFNLYSSLAIYYYLQIY